MSRLAERDYREVLDALRQRGVPGPVLEPLSEMVDGLHQENQRLTVRVFQLQSLFEVSRVLAASLDEEAIKDLFTATLMGHLLVSRCALFLTRPGGGLQLARARGVRLDAVPPSIRTEDAEALFEQASGARLLSGLSHDEEGQAFARLGLTVAVPFGPRASLGLAAVGERASRAPLSEEDVEFVQTLAGQALAALESARLHRVEIEKQRQDREIQIAREIQQSLLPQQCPRVSGFELAAQGHPCRQVGGDHYDFIPLPDGRLALVIADVAGKGTPASILMASVHASVRALAGTAEPAALVARLNRFLFESTQAHRYVTLFYGELDPRERRLRYVNAGHVPPYGLRADGRTERLMPGGPVLGLFAEVEYETADLELDPGDLVALVTDGVTESSQDEGKEFGDEGVWATLLRARDRDAEDVLRVLVEAARGWAGPLGCADDLTAMVLRALPAS